MESVVSRLQLMVFLLAAALLVGCGGVQDSRVGTSAGMAGAFGGTCADGTSAVGEVYEASNDSTKMTEQARGLVSATLVPTSLGTVPARGGIDLELKIPRNLLASGSFLTGASLSGKIRLLIKDSWTGTVDTTTKKTIQAYPVSISKISNAGRNAFGSYEVVFSDQYGSMTVTFTSTGQRVSGTISYQNLIHVQGQTPASGLLGSFSIPDCAVFY
ncbi:MAG: hypothetical protein KF789_15235 [Bdellovibrionaceae bacterium]|nr:hypothetical protein [Pseudobdellovibrionaceae bacterium]